MPSPQSKVKVRRPYEKTVRLTVNFSKPTMAKQSFKDECDINTIMGKYQKTGLIEHVQKVQGAYGDFTSVQDYQLSLNQVIEAQEAFDALPSKIRKRFNNDPAHLMAFMGDPANIEEAITLGLAEFTPIPQPEAAPAASEAPAGADPATKGAKPPAAQ